MGPQNMKIAFLTQKPKNRKILENSDFEASQQPAIEDYLFKNALD